jgi:amino acid transporter
MRERRLIEHKAHTVRAEAMSVCDGFFYNFLAMGVIFPWVYLWGPAAFPGANVALAIVLAFLAQLPISVAYSFLAAAMPENGGDYVYQRKAFGKLGSIAVLSGFVVWILQWVALSGWLFATLGLAPLLMSFSAAANSKSLTLLAIIIESPGGVFVVSIALTICAVFVLKRGLRVFATVQRVLFGLTVLSVVAILIVFMRPQAEIASHLNHFVGILAGHLELRFPTAMTADFIGFLQSSVRRYGYATDPRFSFLATLGVVPIAWTSLQWATYSVEQNEDIESSNRLGSQLIMFMGSSSAVAAILVIVAYLEKHALGAGFLNACSGAYWARRGSPETYLFIRNVLQPFPNVLAIASSGSRLASVVIVLGFLANAFQVTCNCFIGVGKIIAKMQIDKLFPSGWRLSECDSKTKAPMRAYWLYLTLALPVIAGYSLVARWGEYTLGVTFACGYVFMLTAMAAVKLSSDSAVSKHYASQRVAARRIMKACAYGGSILAGIMVVSYLVVPKLGLTGFLPYSVVIGVIIACALWVFMRSRKIKEHPPLTQEMNPGVGDSQTVAGANRAG